MSTGENKKIVVIPNFLIFNKKEKNISYNYLLLQIRNKIVANKKIMPTKLLKKLYIQSRVSSDTVTQFEPCLCENSIQLFATAIEMFDTLTTVFGNPNRKQIAHPKYQTLQQSNYKFSDFWANF